MNQSNINVLNKLTARTVDCISLKDLESKLNLNRPLRIKFGIDPTKPDIHIGHVVVLQKLREFQEEGHTAIALMGDYTAKIGDPSGKSETRSMLGDKEIAEAVKSYMEQIDKILLPERLEIRYNSEWLQELKMEDILQLTSKATVAQLLTRNDFNERYNSSQPLSIVELMYPLMQGYDSVALEADVELGGTDQLFNLHMGRHLQEQYGQKPQIVMTMPLLVGLDGTNKMSKSLGNYIAIDEDPNTQFAKLMSINDDQIMLYGELAAFLNSDELKELTSFIQSDPNGAKRYVARKVVDFYGAQNSGEKAEAEFNNVFKKNQKPADIEVLELSRADDLRLAKILVAGGLCASGKEASRSITQGSVKVNGVKVTDPNTELNDDDTIQVGKRKWLDLRINV
jgi:tyrosyl-tRNA synthetase